MNTLRMPPLCWAIVLASLCLSAAGCGATPQPTSARVSGVTNQSPPPAAQRAEFLNAEQPGGGEIVTEADTANLDGTSQSFKSFITTVLQQTRGQTCHQWGPPVMVENYDSRGFATGAVGCAGRGSQVLWAVADGFWIQIASTQANWLCAPLIKYEVPDWILGANNQCISGSSGTFTTYTHS